MSATVLIALIITSTLVASAAGVAVAHLFVQRHPIAHPVDRDGHTQRRAEEVARDSRAQRDTIFEQMEALRTGRRK